MSEGGGSRQLQRTGRVEEKTPMSTWAPTHTRVYITGSLSSRRARFGRSQGTRARHARELQHEFPRLRLAPRVLPSLLRLFSDTCVPFYWIRTCTRCLNRVRDPSRPLVHVKNAGCTGGIGLTWVDLPQNDITKLYTKITDVFMRVLFFLSRFLKNHANPFPRRVLISRDARHETLSFLLSLV